MPKHLSAAILLAALFAVPAHAQWTANGYGVATGPAIEFRPAACRDGANGAFVAWVDCRNGANTDLYAQHLQSDGTIAAGWPAGGLAICAQADAQTLPVIASEPSGGFWLAWTDYRDGGIDVFVTRVLADGSPAAGWPADGIAVATGAQVRTEPALVADGTGGVYVAWSQNAAGFEKDLLLTRFAGDGSRAAGWPAAGTPLSSGTNANVAATLCADGGAGVYACWQELGGTATVWLRRADPDGSFPAGWSAPFPVWSGLSSIASAQVLPAASGSALVVAGISSGGPTGLDVWTQRVAGDGTVFAGWSPGGFGLCNAVNAQQNVHAIPDGAGGAVVAWEDFRGGAAAQLFASHMDGTSSTGLWPVDGASLVSSPVRGAPSIALDGLGGFIVFIEDAWVGGSDLRAAARTLAGASIAGWGSTGNLVCTAPDEQSSPIAIPSDAGSAIVVWSDLRGGTQEDVYAAKMASDGSVPALASLVRATATPGAVELEWYVPGESGSIGVERAGDDGGWAPLGAAAADGAGYVRWTDATVTAGATYDYRLRLAGSRTLGQTRVTVPLAAGFALASPWPNPARGRWTASFALADDGPATLSLVDVAGRVVASRDAAFGAGRHVLGFDSAGLSPGLYFLRLEQGSLRDVRRMAIAK